MKRWLGIWALSTCCLAQQSLPVKPSQVESAPLVHVEDLVGDQYNGFTQSCLLVDRAGNYHREVRRQNHPHGHATAEWSVSEVFRGALETADLEQLNAIVESGKFVSVSGIVGNLDDVRWHLVVSPEGVFPHADMEIFAASVVRAKGTQVIEIVGDHPEMKDSIQPFKNWVAAITRRKATSLGSSAADFCAVSVLNGGSTWQPITRLMPTASYAPQPDYPITEKNAKDGTVTVRAMVNPDGSVQNVSVVQGKSSTLDQLALDAVRKWTFAPAVLYGFAIPARVDVEVRFHKN